MNLERAEKETGETLDGEGFQFQHIPQFPRAEFKARRYDRMGRAACPRVSHLPHCNHLRSDLRRRYRGRLVTRILLYPGARDVFDLGARQGGLWARSRVVSGEQGRAE